MSLSHRSFILLATIISFLNSYGQYHPFIDTNKKWNLVYSWKEKTDPRPPEQTFFEVYFEGDTLINNQAYKKLMAQNYLHTYYISSTLIVDDTLRPPYLYSFLREDTLLKKVYIIRDPQTSGLYEDLLFDFSLNAGDTLKGEYYLSLIGYPVVDTVSTISLNDGSSRKIFYVHPYSSIFSIGHGYFIEGIGGNNGIVDPFWLPSVSLYESSTEIICYEEDTVQLYGSCNIHAGIHSVQHTNKIEIFPNPFHTTIQVSINPSTNSNCSLEIYDAIGRKVYHNEMNNSKEWMIDLGMLDNGTYFFIVNKGRRHLQMIKKMVKL